MLQEIYNFDLIGNRQTAEIQGKNQTYKLGNDTRLLSDANDRYEYDREGNRIPKTSIKDGSTTKYTWDNRNRLIKIQTPTNEIEYLYDYQNRLVKRTENKTAQQYFIHDNWQIVIQFDNKNLQPTHRNLWGTKQDELLCDNENWMLGDHLNTISDIVKSDGTVVDHLAYNSFGKLISVTKNPDSTFFAYTGKLTDKSSDLQWNINRWYDSDVGRWMSEDPIGFNGGDWNLYKYASNNVNAKQDLFGLADHNYVLAGIVRSTSYTKTIKVAGQDQTLTYSIDRRKVIHNGTHGNLDNEIGYTATSYYVSCLTPRCAKKNWYALSRKLYFFPRIVTGIIIVKIIRPLPNTGVNRNIWQHSLEDYNTHATVPITLTKFEEGTKNHEDHHYQTFVKAIEYIKDAVNTHENNDFLTQAEAEKDCDLAVEKINNIWVAALNHSNKYDSPTWKSKTYTTTIYTPFTYP
jgi:RHS repeat-associated protein